MKWRLCIILLVATVLLGMFTGCSSAEKDDSAFVPTDTPSGESPETPCMEAPPEESETPVKEYMPKTVLSENTETVPELYVEVSVNPCVGFLVDALDEHTVCGITFVNEDAEKILSAEEFIGHPFDEAYALLLVAFVENGYAAREGESDSFVPNITFSSVTSANDEYDIEPIENTGSDYSASLEKLRFYIDSINGTLTESLNSGDSFEPETAVSAADSAWAAANVERREYTYTVDPVPFDLNMYSWRFSIALENTGNTVMEFCSYRALKRLGGETGTIVYDRTWQPDEWSQRGRPLELAPGESYVYNDGHPVEDSSFDYMGYFFTFTDATGKTIEIVYHFNLTFNLPQKN